jgi:hypothetical protein
VQPLLQWKSNKYYIFWVCVCSLSYPACNAHAPYYIVICDLPRSTTFSHIISKMARFSEKLLNTKCVFWFSLQLLSETSLILRIMQRDITMYIGLHVKYSLFLSDFNKTWFMSIDFRKNTQISYSMKIRPVAAELCHADGPDMTKFIVAFPNFANAPKS